MEEVVCFMFLADPDVINSYMRNGVASMSSDGSFM